MEKKEKLISSITRLLECANIRQLELIQRIIQAIIK